MATLAQANKARSEHSDALIKAGAHAIGVEPGAGYGHDGYVVVAYVEPKKKTLLPGTLAAGKSRAEVPVVVEKAEMFRAESFKPEKL